VTPPPSSRILIALGGNAILRKGEKGTAAEQLDNVRIACRHVARIVRRGHSVVLTHGNGPQVGDILLKDELARRTLPPMPLDVCGAESQGMLGYMIQQSLRNELAAAGLRMDVATILTETVVDPADPAFRKPTKPIGPFYTRAEAARLKAKGWTLVNDSGRGYRRVVPSPHPLSMVQGNVIRELLDAGAVVIAAGGGGVPVTAGGESRGVEAVIDKDLGAAVLASLVGARILLILTDVDEVYIDYEKETQRPLERMVLKDCERLLRAGQFAAGSMGPKVESAIAFLRSGGRRAIITSLEKAEDALDGKAGTTIRP